MTREDVLAGRVGKVLLKGIKWSGLISQVGENLVQNVRDYIQTAEGSEHEREQEVLSVAVACLQLFVQNNWTGPPSKTDPVHFFPDDFIQESEIPELKNGLHDELSVDGESIYNLTIHPLYLFIAKTILTTSLQSFKQCQTHEWWMMRCSQLHQKLLRERSPSLMSEFTELRSKVLDKESELLKHSLSAAVEFHIEAALTSLFYFEYKQTRDHLARAAELAGLEIGFTGVLGKRTKYQEKDAAQLIVTAKRTKHENCSSDAHKEQRRTKSLPKNIPLENEVLLDQMKVAEGQEVPQADLMDYEQSLVMAICLEHKKIQARSSLLDDEMIAYVDYILSQARSWPVTTHALFLRSVLQKGSFKKMERTLLQLEEILRQFRAEDRRPLERVSMFFSSALPPSWVVERELGYIQVSLGSTKTALELFLRLQSWSDVIECYQVLGRREKAEAIIREQLAVKETPDMYCYLGDVTHDVQYYEKAWELSGGRHSRAQKNWGLQLFSEGKTEESIDHFEKCLHINPLQEELWFTYGCACMSTGKLKTAIAGFRRSINIEMDNFQAWNNLAACLIKDDQKEKALTILNEAIKCKFDSWRLWENYLMTAIDLGNFSEGIKAYGKMLDLKDKFSDIEVLKILVRAVNENLPDQEGNPSAPLRPTLQQLFGRITSKVTGEAGVWEQYAKLIGHEENEENNVRVIQYLQKALRCMTQNDDWLKDVEKSREVAKEAGAISDAYLEFAQKSSNTAQVIQFLAAAKLSLKGIDTKLRQKHQDTMGSLLPEMVESCEMVAAKLQQIIEKITELKSS